MVVADYPTQTSSNLGASQSIGGSYTSSPLVNNDSTEALASQALVKQWQEKIIADKAKWEPDFKRMRENMKFAKGLQWAGQTTVDTDKYVNNIALRMVNQKVAALYARNPTAVATPRKRMDYHIWDEKIESISQAIQTAEMTSHPEGPTGGQVDMGAMALIQDYNQGQAMERMVEKICKTLEVLYKYQVDSQQPEFKEQMKQLVRRVIITGVGYLKINFIRENTDEGSMPVDHVPSTLMDRAKRAKVILDKLANNEIEDDSAEVETLKSLFASMGASQRYQEESLLSERIEFDFPQATSIIPSSNCRSLKEFIGASYVTHEYTLPIDEVNAFYDVRIETGTGDDKAKEYETEGPNESFKDTFNKSKEKRIRVWEVFDRITKTTLTICDGYKNFLVSPEPVEPCVSGFWKIFALTFNDIESEDNLETCGTIFPPSDVELIRHPQKEWNRTRHALRAQRNSNAPKYVVRKGILSDDDKELLESAEPNSVIELESIPADAKPHDFIMPMQVAAIDPKVYDTAPLEKDIQLAGGMQQANMGPAQPDVTATVGTIAEQSRQVETTSNVDDLDGFLSRVMCATGEMMLREFQVETVKQIVGVGAVWPDATRDHFVMIISLSVVAGSSGRPNQALEIRNWQIIGPMLQQMGANRYALIEETVKRYDDRLDWKKMFPVPEPPPQQPQKPVSESLNYKDAPDDIRRQIEMKAGLQPSQDGKMSEGQAGDKSAQKAKPSQPPKAAKTAKADNSDTNNAS